MAIIVRFARPGDAAGILAIYAPYCETSPISFEIVPPTAEQMAERIQAVLAQYPWLVCEIDGEIAGYVYATKIRERAAYRWAIEVAVYVATRHHRRGVAQALYTALFSILRAQNYYKAYAGITLPNTGSVRLHEAVGFRPVGAFLGIGYKLGKWLDVGWWQLDLLPEVETPPEPRPITEICQNALVTQALKDAEGLVRPAPNG
jgi:L-amino acid N-acyltransferase YncA